MHREGDGEDDSDDLLCSIVFDLCITVLQRIRTWGLRSGLKGWEFSSVLVGMAEMEAKMGGLGLMPPATVQMKRLGARYISITRLAAMRRLFLVLDAFSNSTDKQNPAWMPLGLISRGLSG